MAAPRHGSPGVGAASRGRVMPVEESSKRAARSARQRADLREELVRLFGQRVHIASSERLAVKLGAVEQRDHLRR